MSSQEAKKQTDASGADAGKKSETGKPEVEYFPPSTRLRDKVKVMAPGTGLDMSAIERAEKAMDKLSVRFEGWMTEEVNRLQAARDDVDAQGYSGEYAGELFRSAHDLKGQGMTFGYPLVTYTAGSLCKLLEALNTSGTKSAPIELIDHHVDAIRAIVRDRIKDNSHKTASELVNQLSDATDTYTAALLQAHQ